MTFVSNPMKESLHLLSNMRQWKYCVGKSRPVVHAPMAPDKRLATDLRTFQIQEILGSKSNMATGSVIP